MKQKPSFPSMVSDERLYPTTVAQFKALGAFLSFILLLLPCGCTSTQCSNLTLLTPSQTQAPTDTLPEPVAPERLWRLIPESETVPAEFSKAVLRGSLDAETRKELALLVGRLKDVPHNVSFVDSWPAHSPFAALVYVPGHVFHFVLNADHRWEIVGMGFITP